MTIRKAQPKDAEKIAQLLVIIASLHHTGRPDIYADNAKYDVKQVREMIDDKDKFIFVSADENDNVAGYIICFMKERKFNTDNKNKKTLYVDDLCVDENYRHLGIGKALLLKARDFAVENNCFNVELHVWSFNENAIHFYEGCGMTEQFRTMEFKL